MSKPIQPAPDKATQCADAIVKAKIERGTISRSDIAAIIREHYSEVTESPKIEPKSEEDFDGLIGLSPESLESLRTTICDLAQFRRRHSTKWSERELKALRKVFPYSLEDLATIVSWYDADEQHRTYCRRDILTLLNNWPGEIDRAKQFAPRIVAQKSSPW